MHQHDSKRSSNVAEVHRAEPRRPEFIVKSLLAGGIAGSVAKTATAPLDRVKILFQGGNTHFVKFTGSVTGSLRAVSHIWATEGMRGLYKGHSATLLRIFPYAAVNFMAYEQFKALLIPRDGKEHPFARLAAGAMAGTTSVLCTYPLDIVHARLAYQVKINRYKSVGQTLRATIAEGGVPALYKGFFATVIGIIPYAGISFYTYESLKRLCYHSYPQFALNEDGDVKVAAKLACGAIAGAVSQTAAYPLDLVRRRQQLEGLATNVPIYKHTFHALSSIAREQGVRALFIGLSINYIKVAPQTSISFVTYEFCKKLLNIPGKGGEM